MTHLRQSTPRIPVPLVVFATVASIPPGLTAQAAAADAWPSSNGTTSPQPPPGFVSHVVDVGTAKLHYLMGGKGPALLLVHGWPETWYEWRKVMPALAQRHTVIVPDLRGFGDSSLV